MITAKLYGWIAGAVILMLVVGGIYAKGQLDARHASEIASVRADLATAELVIANERKARQADALLAAAAKERQVALNIKIDGLSDYVETLEDRNRVCLSGADTERLRDLW